MATRSQMESVKFLLSPSGGAFESPPAEKLAPILIIDDEPDDLVLIEMAFRAIGATEPIHAVHSAREAIAYIKGEGKFSDRNAYQYPAFVMTDLNMPGGGGVAVLEYLQSHPEYPVVPTIVFSSSTQPHDVGQCYRLGARGFCLKPSSTEELRHQLKIVHDFWMTCEKPEVTLAGLVADPL